MTALSAASAELADTPSLIDSLTIAKTQFTVAWTLGRAHLALKDIADFVGLSWPAQWRRIQTTSDRFNYCHMATVGADGKQREMICLPVAEVPRWLDGINPAKLAADVAARLAAFKAALFDAFIGQQIARLTAERDEARAWVAAHRAEWLAQKRIRSKVLALMQDGLVFAAIWRAVGAPRHVVADTLRALAAMGFIVALPAGTEDVPRQIDLFAPED